MTRATRLLSAATLALLAGFGTAEAQQSCTHNGQTYPDGTRIGDIRCQSGNWVVVQ